MHCAASFRTLRQQINRSARVHEEDMRLICMAWHRGLAFRSGKEFDFFSFFCLFGLHWSSRSKRYYTTGDTLVTDDIPPAGIIRLYGR